MPMGALCHYTWLPFVKASYGWLFSTFLLLPRLGEQGGNCSGLVLNASSVLKPAVLKTLQRSGKGKTGIQKDSSLGVILIPGIFLKQLG